jgi:hypothetical protein
MAGFRETHTTYHDVMDYQGIVSTDDKLGHIVNFRDMDDKQLRSTRHGFFESMHAQGADEGLFTTTINPALALLRQQTLKAYNPKSGEMDNKKISQAIEEFVTTLTPHARTIVKLQPDTPQKWVGLAQKDSIAVLACCEVEMALRERIPEIDKTLQMRLP